MTRDRGNDVSSGASSRVYWIDFAKALAISLVVIYHVGVGMNFLFPAPSGSGSAFWTRFNLVAVPLRMPLFFLAAGILAHSSIGRPWATVTRPRVLVLLWPYVLWTVAFACVAGFAYRPDNPIGYGIDRILGLPFARSGYWFLLVLVVFFVVAKLLRRWAPIVLTVALVVALAAPWLEAHVFNEMHWLTVYGITRVARYAFWYLLGCYAYRQVSRVTSVNPIYLVVGGGAVFVALTWLAYRTGMASELVFALSVAGVTAMVGLSVWSTRLRIVRRISRYLAARTLPIYLIHPMLIVLIVLIVLIARLLGGADHPNNGLATLLVPVIAALSIAASVLLYDRVKTSRAAWMFRPPVWLERVGRVGPNRGS